MILAVFSSVAAMGQSEKKKSEPDWLKDFTSRITLNGYAQGGWSYQNPNGEKTTPTTLNERCYGPRHASPTAGRFCSCTISRA